MNQRARRPIPEQRLRFRAADRRFSLRLASVRRVATPEPYARLPLQPCWLLGLVNIGGEALGALDLAAWLGRPASPIAPRLLVVEAVGARLAVLVDEVLGLSGERQVDSAGADGSAHEAGQAAREPDQAVHEPPLLDLGELVEAVEVALAALAPLRGAWPRRSADATSGG